MADPNKLKYRLQPVKFKGTQTHIICYHGDFAVLPTAVAVANFFLLTEPSYFKFDRTVEFVSYWDLQQMVVSLKDKVVAHLKELHKKSWDKDKEVNATNAAVTSLELLDESSLQPINIFTSGFLESPIIPILGYLEIPIQHGWIVPNENKYQKLRNKISGDPTLQLKGMGIANDFLQNSQTELTQYGIQLLSNAIPERSLCALYRKDLINLVYKHQGNLYLLVTEGHVLDIPPTAIWKSLTVVYGEEVFFTEDFVPLPADEQPNETGKKWAADWQKKLADSAARKRGKKKKRPVIANTPLSSSITQEVINIPLNSTEDHTKLERPPSPDRVAYAPAPSDSLNGQTTSVPDASKVPVPPPISVIWKLAFLDFLEKYIYGGSGVYYFPAMLEFMKRVALFKFEVRISDIAQHHPVLALAIQGDIESFTELLTQPVIDFMIKKEFDAEEVIKKRVKLIFHDDMPV